MPNSNAVSGARVLNTEDFSRVAEAASKEHKTGKVAVDQKTGRLYLAQSNVAVRFFRKITDLLSSAESKQQRLERQKQTNVQLMLAFKNAVDRQAGQYGNVSFNKALMMRQLRVNDGATLTTDFIKDTFADINNRRLDAFKSDGAKLQAQLKDGDAQRTVHQNAARFNKGMGEMAKTMSHDNTKVLTNADLQSMASQVIKQLATPAKKET